MCLWTPTALNKLNLWDIFLGFSSTLPQNGDYKGNVLYCITFSCGKMGWNPFFKRNNSYLPYKIQRAYGHQRQWLIIFCSLPTWIHNLWAFLLFFKCKFRDDFNTLWTRTYYIARAYYISSDTAIIFYLG